MVMSRQMVVMERLGGMAVVTSVTQVTVARPVNKGAMASPVAMVKVAPREIRGRLLTTVLIRFHHRLTGLMRGSYLKIIYALLSYRVRRWLAG